MYVAIVIIAIALVAMALLFIARQMAVPSATVLVQPDGSTLVTIVPSNLESRRRILFALSYLGVLRAAIWTELERPEAIEDFDDFVRRMLDSWPSVLDGSALRSDLGRQLVDERTNLQFSRYYATLDTGRLPVVASAINRPCDPPSVKLQFLALLVEIAQPMSRSHRDVLRFSLEAWHLNRDGLKTDRLDVLGRARVQASQYAARCLEVALRATSVDEAEIATGAPTVETSFVLARWALVSGQIARSAGFLSYPIAWIIGASPWLPLVFYGALGHLASHAVGGIGVAMGLGREKAGRYSRADVLANILVSDGMRYLALSPLAGIAIGIARWVDSGQVQEAFGLAIASTLGCAAFGWSLSSAANVVKASVVARRWRYFKKVSEETHDLELPLPLFPGLNLLLSQVYITYFVLFFLLLLATAPITFWFDPRTLERNGASTWQAIGGAIVIGAVLTLWKYVAGWLSQLLLRRLKSPLRVLVLRRFADWASRSTRTIVAPTFGSLGHVTIVRDKTYDEARPHESYDIENVEKLLDTLSDYDSLVSIEGDWKPPVLELIRSTHLCVIDVSEVGEGVAWEIKAALEELPVDRIVLVASFEKAIQSGDALFAQVHDGVTNAMDSLNSQDSSNRILVRMATLDAPLLYGPFPLSMLFRFRLWRLTRRLRQKSRSRHQVVAPTG